MKCVSSRHLPCARAALCALWLFAACTGNFAGSGGSNHDTDGRMGGAAGGGGQAGAQVPGATGRDGTGVMQTKACAMPTAPPAQPLRRLTARQYHRAIGDVIELATTDPAVIASVKMEIAPALADVPDDPRPHLPKDEHGTFRRLEQSVQQVFVDGVFEVAEALGAALTKPDRLAKVIGPCQADAAACVEGFIRRFGERLWRRPLDEADVAFYQKVYGDTSKVDPAGFAHVIGALVLAPGFLYVLEHGEGEVAGLPGVRSLGAYELASRLALHFWDTLPDDRLWQAARTGELLTADGYAREVERLFASERARPVLDAFISEWLLLEELPALDNLNEDPQFKAFAGPALPSATLGSAMIDELIDLGRYFVVTKPGTFDDLLTTDVAFPRTAELARLYGLAAPWSGTGDPPQLPAGTRPGYLTRAGMLASGGARTRPVLRGTLLRTKTLCDAIPPPPGDAMEQAEKARTSLPASATTREETVYVTEDVAPSCKACHQRYINPLGFALEGFDALGRLRTKERVFDAKGKLLAEAPIDSAAVAHIGDDDDQASVAGAADLVERIRDSGKAHTCFARHYVRFTFGRVEDVDQDACAIGALTTAMKDRAPLPQLLRSIAFTPAFQTRTFPTL